MATDGIVDWFLVVSVSGDLEGTRETAARALEYAASEIRRPGFSGGNYATPGNGTGDAAELEVHLALGGPPAFDDARVMDLGDGGGK
jgi:hypothetical protein